VASDSTSTPIGTGPAFAGVSQISLAEVNKSALVDLRGDGEGEFSGLRIGVSLYATKETAALVRQLRSLGAEVSLCGFSAFSTQDDTAAALAAEGGVSVHAVHGCSTEQLHRSWIRAITDGGCDLTVRLQPHRVAQYRSRGVRTNDIGCYSCAKYAQSRATQVSGYIPRQITVFDYIPRQTTTTQNTSSTNTTGLGSR